MGWQYPRSLVSAVSFLVCWRDKMMSASYTSQPPAVVTRILGEFGDLNTTSPSYTEEEAAVMIQVTHIPAVSMNNILSGVNHELSFCVHCPILDAFEDIANPNDDFHVF